MLFYLIVFGNFVFRCRYIIIADLWKKSRCVVEEQDVLVESQNKGSHFLTHSDLTITSS